MTMPMVRVMAVFARNMSFQPYSGGATLQVNSRSWRPAMTPRTLAWGVLAVLILAAGGFGIWLAMLPTDRAFAAPAISAAEAAATVAALDPAGDRRPLIAVIGLNDSTETTDYLMPAGI